MAESLDRAGAAAARFNPDGDILGVEAYGNGNINDTFLVILGSGAAPRFILQRINRQVFPRPELVMQNLRASTEHLAARLAISPVAPGRRWEVPRVLLTRDGQDRWIAPDGSFWRGISFIEASESFDTIQNIRHAGEVGYAVGTFHRLISDLSLARLADTLEGFHVTPRYLRHYDHVLARVALRSSPELAHAARFVAKRRACAAVLEDARAGGRLRLRPIHGDPKVNNVMIDIVRGEAVSLVDLDTVKPGLVHYDIGDCLRSSCNCLGEETERWEQVCFEPELGQAILQGYLSAARGLLDEADYDYLYDCLHLIAFELGLRFLTDYLEGSPYFKVRHPEQNLLRALVQFQLTESIESQAREIRAILQALR
jgi:Ser/Thr protein kinase RdoA (MazF antagonist)